MPSANCMVNGFMGIGDMTKAYVGLAQSRGPKKIKTFLLRPKQRYLWLTQLNAVARPQPRSLHISM
jgi:hypothetical protein